MSKPKVVVHQTASLDGRLAIVREKPLLFGDERWQAFDRSAPVTQLLHYLHQPQATLEGSNSFVPPQAEPEPLPAYTNDPAPLYDDYLPSEIVDRAGQRGWFTAVDGRGRIRWQYKDGAAFGEEWRGWYALVLVGHHTPPAYLAYLRREQIPYLVAGDGPVDLSLALTKLGEKLNVTCILSTAGGTLNGALIRTGLVDEVNVVFCPAVVGGIDTPALFDSPALTAEEMPVRLKLLSTQVYENDYVWLRYSVGME
jgi:riboflavin biosynthesis pyrimidine reductase